MDRTKRINLAHVVNEYLSTLEEYNHPYFQSAVAKSDGSIIDLDSDNVLGEWTVIDDELYVTYENPNKET